MLFVALFIAVLLVVIIIFSFPQFSPIPYFPSNKQDLPIILKSLQLTKNQIVVDLGAGDGIVIFKAAKLAFKKKLNTRFIAVEINPVLLAILYLRRLLHPNRKNIKVMYGNMFSMRFETFKHSSVKTFYLYISPWHLKKTINNIKLQFNHFSIISYMYEIPFLKLDKKIEANKHPIFVYNLRNSSKLKQS